MDITTNTTDVSKHGINSVVETISGSLGNTVRRTLTQLKALTTDRLQLNNAPTAESVNDTASPHILATVIRTTLETHDTKSYFFSTETPLKPYKAGAHINIEFTANGDRVVRTYTLSSSPKTADEFSITVKRVNHGVASNWLFDHLTPGDQINVSQPQGSFVLPYQPAGKLLMLSAGSGITPVMSMLRYLSQTGNRSDIVFLNYAQSPSDIIFHDELTALAKSHPNLSILFSVEREALSGESLEGRINEKQVSEVVPDILEREIYLCGPQPFMKATISILNKLEFNPAQLHLENFTADLSGAAELGYSAELSFTSINKAVQAASSKTILEEAEAAGLNPAAACRIGICKTCRCKKQSGTTVNLVTGEVSTEEGDYILPCVSVAKTATTVEL